MEGEDFLVFAILLLCEPLRTGTCPIDFRKAFHLAGERSQKKNSLLASFAFSFFKQAQDAVHDGAAQHSLGVPTPDISDHIEHHHAGNC